MKKAEMDYNTIARYGIGGAAVGAGTASLVNLAHQLKMMMDERKRKMKTPQTDENTIVLTLPRKQGAACAAITKTEGPSSREYMVNRGQKQSRDKNDGKYGPTLTLKAAGSGWPTMTASWLAAIGGGAGGTILANEIYKKYRERQLKREVEAAKAEYMDMLTRQVKGASVIEDMFTLPTQEKQAQEAFGTLSYPMAALALMTILGSGATGYLTKKVLDEKLRENDSQSLDIPKVKRIVFRTAKPGEGEKLAENEEPCDMADLEAVAGSLMVMMDKVASADTFTRQVAKEAELAGLTPAKLVKLAEDVDVLMNQLRQAPDLRKALYNVYNQHTGGQGLGASTSRFFKGMALKTPMGQQYADKKLYAMLLGLKDGTNKIASISPGGLVGGAMGGALGGVIGDNDIDPKVMAELVAKAQARIAAEEELKKSKVPGNVRVQAADKGAARYLTANKEKLQGIIRRMASEGQL